jgi:hypothetical protein
LYGFSLLLFSCWNVLRFYRSHEARARRNLQQINSGLGVGSSGFGDMEDGGGFAGQVVSKLANAEKGSVRPSLSDSANRKRSLA